MNSSITLDSSYSIWTVFKDVRILHLFYLITQNTHLSLKHHDEGGAVAALSDHPFPLIVNLL